MVENEVETISGFDIPKRELTKEEGEREITVERIRDFHYSVGEDFIDTTGEEGNTNIFCGWLLHKYPESSKEILKIANENRRYLETMQFNELDIMGFDDDMDIDKIYFEFVEFANQTISLKKRINQVLIQITENYGE